MSVIARLEVIPTREGNMSAAVASALSALDRFDVSYETTPTDTVIEADDPGEVFAAAEAAHRAVADERVITSLEVDEQRTRAQSRHDRVASVERELGHPPERERPGSGAGAHQQGTTAPGASQQGTPTSGSSRQGGVGAEPPQQGAPATGTAGGEPTETELRRYHGPVPTDQQGGSRQGEPQQGGSPQGGSQQSGSRQGEPRYTQSRRGPSR